MKVRHKPARVDHLRGPYRSVADPKWATALVLGAVAVATLAITGSPQDVPVVVGTVLVALGISPERS